MSLSLKDYVANIISGYVIIFSRPFRVHDRIKILPSGAVGDVLAIGTRATRVQLDTGDVLLVPNSELVNGQVINMNYPSHATRGQFNLTLAYGSNLEQACQIISTAIQRQKKMMDAMPSQINALAFTDSGIKLQVLYYLTDFMDEAKVKSEVLKEVYQQINQSENVRLASLHPVSFNL